MLTGGAVTDTGTTSAPPSLGQIRFSGAAFRRPKLSLTVTAGTGAPLLSEIQLTPPTGLKLHASRLASPAVSASNGLVAAARARHPGRIGGSLQAIDASGSGTPFTFSVTP